MKINKPAVTKVLLMSLFASSLVFILLSGCSDRGGDTVLMTPEGKEGRFIDSHVEGLRYSSFNYAGVTGPNGTFIYHPGLPVTFSVGYVTLGTASPEDIVTPIDLVGKDANINHPKVVNIAQFLQSLDLDGEPRNGIAIPEMIQEGLVGHAINFSAEDFPNSDGVQRVFGMLNDNNVYAEERTLVSAEEAQIHLEETLIEIEQEAIEAEANRDTSLNAYIQTPRYHALVIAGTYLNMKGAVLGGTPDYEYFWDFGDGWTSQRKDPGGIPGLVLFDTPGTYTVLFTAMDSNEDSDSDFRFITVIRLSDYSQPYDETVEVYMTMPEDLIRENLNVMTGESLHLPAKIQKGNPPIGYYWIFDNTVAYTWDGDPLDATFTFYEKGRHTIKIFCRDATDDTWVDSVTINVQDNTD
ncbi:MAG: PKD domain-containing protein [Deltaproteobacteria bacterium]|nr:PKD domain-containing protein [Deltaproteobacteria bacterium]